MKIKKHNFKFLVGFLIGLSFVGGVYAASSISSSLVIYEGNHSSSLINNVQSAIDDLANKIEVPDGCPANHYCEINKNENISLGDYVSYTPSVSSYVVDESIAGWEGDDPTIDDPVHETYEIYPRLSKIWRVISINDDGTIDIITDKLPTGPVAFYSEVGYINYIGYLNVLASKFETPGITVDSRHFGYGGQTEYLEFVTYSWCSTGEYCYPEENKGGGDTYYLTDYYLVLSALGTLETSVNGTTAYDPSYFVASRYYNYYEVETEYEDEETGETYTEYDEDKQWNVRVIRSHGQLTEHEILGQYSDWDYEYYYSSAYYYIRPIVTLKAGINFISGNGSSGSPWKVN